MMVDLTMIVQQFRYPNKPQSARALDRMYIMNILLVACGKRQAPNASDIARQLKMARSTVVRHLMHLSRDGYAKRFGTGYCANLDKFKTIPQEDIKAVIQRLDAALLVFEPFRD
ncbi:helix-turn-helix domain-containing protein [Bradyrhizobium sp. S3.7.6]